MSSKKTSKQSETTRATQLLAGMNKHYSNGPSLTFESATHTPQEIISSLQTLIALRKAVGDAKTAVQLQLVLEKAKVPAILVLMAGLVQFLLLTYSEQPDILADFGLVQKKARTPLTAEQKAAAAAKAKATRLARGTSGSKKAKQAVKGSVVVDTVVTPVKVVPVVDPSAAPGTTGNGGAAGGSTSHGA
jgi:hypothetical protein